MISIHDLRDADHSQKKRKRYTHVFQKFVQK